MAREQELTSSEQGVESQAEKSPETFLDRLKEWLINFGGYDQSDLEGQTSLPIDSYDPDRRQR